MIVNENFISIVFIVRDDCWIIVRSEQQAVPGYTPTTRYLVLPPVELVLFRSRLLTTVIIQFNCMERNDIRLYLWPRLKVGGISLCTAVSTDWDRDVSSSVKQSCQRISRTLLYLHRRRYRATYRCKSKCWHFVAKYVNSSCGSSALNVPGGLDSVHYFLL